MSTKKKKIIISLMISFALLQLTSLFLLNHSNKTPILDSVKLKMTEKIPDGFAVYIEKADKSGYEISTSDTWPTDMVLNNSLSGCIDKDGNKTENSITYENGVINIDTDTTSYCYLYFMSPSCSIGTLTDDKCVVSAASQNWYNEKVDICYDTIVEDVTDCDICGEEYYCELDCDWWYQNCIDEAEATDGDTWPCEEYYNGPCQDDNCYYVCTSCGVEVEIETECTTNIYYYADGWSVYSGEGETLMCYRGII